jgi:adenylate cyclase
LPTRVGLHLGELVLGPVGAGEHFEYRAIGDVVNTASRIEALNKQLGTQVLASAEVVAELPGVDCRPVGRFVLAGKAQALDLYELTRARARLEARSVFEEALAACAEGDVGKALGAFQAVLAADPGDGVAAFYVTALGRGDTLRDDGAIVTVKI